MIANPSTLGTLQTEWDGVIRMRERMRHLVVSTFALNTLTSPVFGDILYNLPFLLAFDVLKQVLLSAREDGHFNNTGYQLDDLMDSARSSLPWIDWEYLREAVGRQNEVAREGKLYGDVECLQDIAHLEAQLAAWGVIAPV
jgi:hypothetical protein